MKMKKIVILLITLIVVVFFSVRGAENEAGTEKEIELKTFMTKISERPLPHRPDATRKTTDQMILEFAKTNNIPAELVTRMAMIIAEESFKLVTTQDVMSNTKAEVLKCARMLGLLGRSGDLSVGPFLDKMSKSTNEYIRIDASLAYINLLGLEAAPFLFRVVLDTQFKEYDRYRMYKTFTNQIKRSENIASAFKVNESYMRLLKIMEKENGPMAVTELDRILCDKLDGYATSIQRERVVKRFSQSETQAVRNHFGKIWEEIEKIPADKRANLQLKNVSADGDVNPAFPNAENKP